MRNLLTILFIFISALSYGQIPKNLLIRVNGGDIKTLQTVTDAGYTTTNPLITTNNIQAGIGRQLIGIGTSYTLAKGTGGITSDTMSYLLTTASALTFVPVNKGLSGRHGQTVLDTQIPTYITGNYLIIETMVNDVKDDSTVYTPALFSAGINGSLDNAVIKGWPTDHIVLLNLAYSNYTLSPNHGDIAYRFGVYGDTLASIASYRGTLILNNYNAFKAQNFALGGTLLYSDSLHPTALGQTYAASLLTAYLDDFTGDPENTTVLSNGSIVDSGSLTVVGNSYLSNLTVSKDLTVAGSESRLKVQSNDKAALQVGGNYGGTAGISLNYRKFGNITGFIYADTTSTAQLIGYDNNVTSNSLTIGGGFYQTNYMATDIKMYTAPIATGLVSNSVYERFRIYQTGDVQIGGSYTDNNYRLNIGGTLPSTGVGILSSTATVTPSANSQTVLHHKFDGTTATGTGLLTATITSSATVTADGTYAAQAVTNITGTGSGGIVTVTVASGVVTVVTSTTGGTGYANGNTFTVAATPDAIFTVASLGYTGVINTQAQFTRYPIQLSVISTPTNLTNGHIWNETTGTKFRNNSVTYSVGSSTILGTVSTGVWNGTAIGVAYGGTNIASYTAGDLITATGTTTLSKLAKGTANQIIGMNNGATTQEYKTFAVSQGVSVTHAANSVTFGLGAITPTSVGIGTAASVPLHVIATTEQQRIGYNSTNYLSTTVGSTGSATWALTGTAPKHIFNQSITFDATYTAGGTTGAQTINKPAGSVNFAAAAQTLVVTNSMVTTTSNIQISIASDDTTAKSAVISAQSSGSFTIKLNAAATAETKVKFIVF